MGRFFWTSYLFGGGGSGDRTRSASITATPICIHEEPSDPKCTWGTMSPMNNAE